MGDDPNVIPDELLGQLNEEELAAVIAALSPIQRDALALDVRGRFAREHFSPEGYRDFYWCLWQREVPDHAYEWVEKIFAAYEKGRGTMLKSFRGSSKSTVLNTTFTLFVTGHRPWGSSLVVQANDKAANKSSGLMAILIEASVGWKACFPNVVPDKGRGWGAEGYFVLDNRYGGSGEDRKGTYEDWIGMTTQDHLRDPSFIASGINSSSIVGMHPSNVLMLDDIHDEENTKSEREVEGIKQVLTANILPIMMRPGRHPFIGVCYTPWTKNDAYALLETWDIFDFISTPVYVEDENGVDFRGKKVRFTWDLMGLDKLTKIENLNEKDFSRMFLLDLSAMEGIYLKMEWVHPFPAEKLDKSYPMYLGVDYASTSQAYKIARPRDHFSVAFVRLVPGVGGVLEDGFDDEVSQGEAEQKLKDLAGMFPTLQVIGVEAVGKGEEFFSLMLRTSKLPIRPCTAVSKGKAYRFEKQLAPMFQFSRMYVSQVETPYIRKFKSQWINWDAAKERTLMSDVLDAVYWAAFVAQGNLMPAPPVNELQYQHTARVDPWRAALKGV